ncbi:MAG: hypothetical protein ACREAC_26245, partial [Blastocatellia bacterium]
TVTTSIVATNQKGVLTLPQDPRISEGKIPHVTITVPSHPDFRAELDIPVRYDYNYTLNFSGNRGGDGMNGRDGSDGLSGSMGSIDPNNPSPGGDGSNGTNGDDGRDGDAGGDALPVQIQVALQGGSHPLLQVKASGADRELLYLLDIQGGSLTVKADGGDGGRGGSGGRGGRGGSGGMGTPSGRERPGRHEWKEWMGRSTGKGRKHHRDIRSPGETVSRYDPAI